MFRSSYLALLLSDAIHSTGLACLLGVHLKWVVQTANCVVWRGKYRVQNLLQSVVKTKTIEINCLLEWWTNLHQLIGTSSSNWDCVPGLHFAIQVSYSFVKSREIHKLYSTLHLRFDSLAYTETDSPGAAAEQLQCQISVIALFQGLHLCMYLVMTEPLVHFFEIYLL